jgi:hypothetical protein
LAILLTGTFVAGLQTLVFALVPLRFLEGHNLVRWRRGLWAAVQGLAIFAFLQLLVRPGAAYGRHSGSVVAIVIVFVGFGAASVAFWGFFARRDRIRAVPA